MISSGRLSSSLKEDHWLDVEPGEFYDLNKSLNQIHNYMKWQKEVLQQESSELEAVISALSGAILAIDSSHKLLFFNPEAAMLFSVPRRTSKKKDTLLSKIIRNPDILHSYEECLRTGEVIKKNIPIDVLGMDEEPAIYEMTIAPLKKEKESPAHGAVGLFYDISNIKKTERSQLDFITNVSHELRTPLTAVQGYVDTLLEGIKTNSAEQMQHFLSIINRNVKRLVSLLEHFLELSKMEGAISLKKEILKTRDLTCSIIQDLNVKDREVKTRFSEEEVYADKHFVKQVLYNLLDNALKYVAKERLIEVIWERENDFTVLKVKDQGEGIPRLHKHRLFERFYRVDPSRAKKGTGIGLSIVKQILERHGGSIEVESYPGSGSVFICKFPDKKNGEKG